MHTAPHAGTPSGQGIQPAACALFIAPLLDFVEFRLHKILHQAKISEKILPEVTAWQNWPLEAVYPFVFPDAIHYKVKENHQYQTKAAYVVLGITMDGTKDILGVWIGEHESSKF